MAAVITDASPPMGPGLRGSWSGADPPTSHRGPVPGGVGPARPEPVSLLRRVTMNWLNSVRYPPYRDHPDWGLRWRRRPEGSDGLAH